MNNDGGGIFQTLPVREHEPAFSEFFSTPHGLDFGKAAELYGITLLPSDFVGGVRGGLCPVDPGRRARASSRFGRGEGRPTEPRQAVVVVEA